MTFSGRGPAGPAHGPGTGPRPPGDGPSHGAWRLTVPALDSSVPRIRHAVRDLLAAEGVPVTEEGAADLLLIVSELVTNAVRHAAVLSPLITVEIEVDAGQVKVAVGDDHPYRPVPLCADPTRTGGRGLLLVEAVTRAAGGGCDVRHTGRGGKVVRATLPFTG